LTIFAGCYGIGGGVAAAIAAPLGFLDLLLEAADAFRLSLYWAAELS